MLIGLSGKRGAGKDTTFRFLERNAATLFPKRRIVRVGFADPIKEYVIAMFGVPKEVAYGDDAAKEALCGTTTVRGACKVIGAAFTSVDNAVFTRKALQIATAHATFGDVVVFTDVRFSHEVQAIQAQGGVVLRLTRAPVSDGHDTETALDGYDGFDAMVDNKGLDEGAACLAVVRELKKLGAI